MRRETEFLMELGYPIMSKWGDMLTTNGICFECAARISPEPEICVKCG